MTAHGTLLYDRVLMDREGFGRANGPINLKQRDITGPPGEPTGTPFSRGGLNQLGLGQLGHDPSDEAGARVHASGDGRRVDLLTLGMAQASHDVGRDRELDVGRHTVTVIITEWRASQATVETETIRVVWRGSVRTGLRASPGRYG
jgi:hypothetical protein